MPVATPQQSVQAPPSSPPVQTTTPEQKKNKGLKIAIIALVIFLIIILSEVGYLVFSGWGRTYFQLKSKSQNETETTAILSPTPVPTPLIEISSPESKVQSNKVDDFLYILKALEPKETFIETMTVNTTYKAIVTGTSQVEKENVGLRYVIEAKNDSGEVVVFSFSKQEIDSAEILLTSNNNEGASFNDIKADDKITVIVASDLFDSSSDSKIILEIERGN